MIGETLKDYIGAGRADVVLGEDNKAVDPKVSVEPSGKVVYGDNTILEALTIEKIDASTAGVGRSTMRQTNRKEVFAGGWG